MERDFTKIGTERLQRARHLHEASRSAMTMEEECRRLYLVEAIGEELARRGVTIH